jgi:glycosyltransferase involved in cell wall biosynthesis
MPGLRLKIVQVGFHVDPLARAPALLLEQWSTLVDVAEATRRAGLGVCVVQASATRPEVLCPRDVPFHFAPLDDGFYELIRRLAPDVLHVHGLGFPDCVVRLHARCPGVPILLQDHANRPPRPWRRRRHRRGFEAASAVAFCAREQCVPFGQADLIRAPMAIYEIPESSSRFTPGEQAEARARTGLHGDPCLLWVAHLDTNKDPMTVLEAVSRTVAALPHLQLWCCYGHAPLARQVSRRIRRDVRLRGRVHLLGQRPHRQIEWLMRSADLFVAASHRESTGYALIEALACGTPPLVSDIPSHRALTGNGAVGRLWRCADPESLAQALRALAACGGVAQRAAVRAHFERELSFAALGERLRACYEALIPAGALAP